MRRPDATAAAAVLAFAAAAVYESTRLPFGTVRNPGPGFLPWWAGLALGVLALICLGQALRGRPAAGPAAPPVERGRLPKVGGLVAVLAAYVLALEPLGYPASTFLLVLFMLRVVDPQRWAMALGVAALASVGSYVVFAVWLQVPLPPGPSLR